MNKQHRFPPPTLHVVDSVPADKSVLATKLKLSRWFRHSPSSFADQLRLPFYDSFIELNDGIATNKI